MPTWVMILFLWLPGIFLTIIGWQEVFSRRLAWGAFFMSGAVLCLTVALLSTVRLLTRLS